MTRESMGGQGGEVGPTEVVFRCPIGPEPRGLRKVGNETEFLQGLKERIGLAATAEGIKVVAVGCQKSLALVIATGRGFRAEKPTGDEQAAFYDFKELTE